jgi:hypothetical protein
MAVVCGHEWTCRGTPGPSVFTRASIRAVVGDCNPWLMVKMTLVTWLVTRSCLMSVLVGPCAHRAVSLGMILATDEKIRDQ